MRPRPPVDEAPPVERDPIVDRNYLMIYQRSVLASYSLSRLHLDLLEQLIDDAHSYGAQVVLAQLPVEPSMRAVQRELVGEVFDAYLEDLQERKSVVLLDSRDDVRFEFQDLNHLSVARCPRLHPSGPPPAARRAVGGLNRAVARGVTGARQSRTQPRRPGGPVSGDVGCLQVRGDGLVAPGRERARGPRRAVELGWARLRRAAGRRHQHVTTRVRVR